MIAHQLDLFGGPLKPPKKIKVDEELPSEVTPQEIMEEPLTEPEFVTDIQANNNAEGDPAGVSNDAEWIKEEEEVENNGDHLHATQNEEIVAATGPHDKTAFDNEDVAVYDEDSQDLNFTDADIAIDNGVTADIADDDSEDEIPDYNDSDIDQQTAESPGTAIATGTARTRKQAQESDYEIEGLNIPPDEQLFKRQYYSMRETSAMFGVNQSLLRFWENEFDILQPKKNKKGDRYFRPVDVKNLVLIYHLLRVRKFTLDGAKDYLQSHKNAGDTFELIRRLEKLKSFLLELKAGL